MTLGPLITCGALLLLAQPLGAQARPDFSGRWTRVDDSTVARGPTVATVGDAAFRIGDMGTGWGTGTSPLTITQRADSLIVEYVFFAPYDLQPPVRLSFAMSGAESVNRVMIGHATSVQRARLTWNGASLVITTDVPLPREVGGAARAITVRHTLTVDSPGSLAIETWRAGVAGASPTTVTTRYGRRDGGGS